ncbi:hypothetical protein KY290_016705 [Solanum tuberosum]|uniref:Secreted protein n=1 Tax=Solanum tuberosum TaxID=4113 RepID=A0ABQ7V992_SOLTU|nr:hypothetical protein KY284_015988 [Solanum tuberosum]KAH0760632.1 hypothetical protein KY290_016705 [Solanum tuberosum]
MYAIIVCVFRLILIGAAVANRGGCAGGWWREFGRGPCSSFLIGDGISSMALVGNPSGGKSI